MMDMEMNAADLGDEGSESSQSSDEGSSVSSTFCVLERNYARILKEMKTNEALASLEPDFTTLFESLYRSHRTEKELTERCMLLEDEAVEYTRKMQELRQTDVENTEEIQKLRSEIAEKMKLADAAHTREQNAQEVIDNLRVTVAKLNEEIAQKNRQLAAGEEGTTSDQQKEMLLKEKEKLANELETVRQRLTNMSVYTEELETKMSEAEQRIAELQETLDIQLNELSKEKRTRQRAEVELQQLHEELMTKTNDLEVTKETIKNMTANSANLETLAKEQRVAGERMQKEINKLMVKKENLQLDFDNANMRIEALHKEVLDKEKLLKTMRQNMQKLKEETEKIRFDRENTEKKLQRMENEKQKLVDEQKQLQATLRNIQYDSLTLRKQQQEKQQCIEGLIREKSVLARNKETVKEQMKRISHELLVCEHSRKKIEHQYDLTVQGSTEIAKRLESVEKERDRYNFEVQELADQVEEYMSEAKLKQVEIHEYKKRLAEAETRYRQQQNLFETIRAERNSCNKALIEARDEIQELRAKLKTLGHQIEQVKEDVAAKEAALTKQEFLLGKVEKEKESLRTEVQTTQKNLSKLRHEIEEKKSEEKRLREEIRRAELEINRQKKEIENVLNERDIVGSQLVRRNDEVTLQCTRIKILEETLQRGEAHYNERLEDIRLLKLEVKRLRNEKLLLRKSIQNVCDMRRELFHLNRTLARERLKVVALEEEVQTPLNIHRWRKLEGTDPERYELLKKVEILQKRVIRMSARVVAKEKKIKEGERLYKNLREALSKQPGPQAAVFLSRTQKALRERGEKMKSMASQLNMYEVELTEHKLDMEKVCCEMRELKKKYYGQKRKLQKSRESELKSLNEPIQPKLRYSKKFCGGGFNMTPKNCLTLVTAAR